MLPATIKRRRAQQSRQTYCDLNRAFGLCPRCGAERERADRVQCGICRMKAAWRMAGRYQRRGGWGGRRTSATTNPAEA